MAKMKRKNGKRIAWNKGREVARAAVAVLAALDEVDGTPVSESRH